MDRTLNACGEYSYLTWSVLEDFSLYTKPIKFATDFKGD